MIAVRERFSDSAAGAADAAVGGCDGVTTTEAYRRGGPHPARTRATMAAAISVADDRLWRVGRDNVVGAGRFMSIRQLACTRQPARQTT